jgi:hypothetical protein
VPDTQADRLIAVFRGTVICVRETGVSPGLTLRGVSAANVQERLIVTFLGDVPQDLPERLAAPSVQAVDAQCYRIDSPPRQWLIRARALHVHRDVGAEFFRAVPPRAVPPRKRLFWTVVLAMARSRAGVWLLRALRRR